MRIRELKWIRRTIPNEQAIFYEADLYPYSIEVIHGKWTLWKHGEQFEIFDTLNGAMAGGRDDFRKTVKKFLISD